MNKKPQKKPSGAAIMITMFSLLLLCSLLVLSTAKSVKSTIVITRNQLYANQAFESAQAGLEFGYAYIKDNYNELLIDNSKNTDPITQFTTAFFNHIDNSYNNFYDVSYTNLIINKLKIITINSKGSSDQGSVQSSVIEQVAYIPFISIKPFASLTTLGNVTLGGNVLIQNLITDNTISSGGNITLKGSASTIASNNIISDKNNSNIDLSSNDPKLSILSKNEFFHKIFGASKNNTKLRADLILNNNTSQNISNILKNNNNNGKAIWINQTSGTASISGNTTIGSAEKPVLLVVDGKLKVNGNTQLYGIIYVTKDWHNTGSGNLTVHGTIIVEGSFSATGTPTIDYDLDVIDKTINIAKVTKIPGSWHDF